MDTQHPIFGQPLTRADGPLKVTGGARYTGDLSLPGMAHAALTPSSVASGRVLRVDTRLAERMPGVLAVLTAANMPRLTPAAVAIANQGGMPGGAAGQSFLPMQDDTIHYAGQPIALVIAETLEQAQDAAAHITADYENTPPHTDFALAAAQTFVPENGWPEPAETSRGNIATGLAAAHVVVDVTYHTAMQHHVTMEPHATVAHWEGDVLTVYEPTTWVYGTRKTLATWFGLPEKQVRVENRFVGGSFGAKGPTWPHVALAAAAARQIGRPVKLTLTRAQTFWSNGYRPPLRQHLRLGAGQDGALSVLQHDALAATGFFDDRIVAPVTKTSPKIYACPHVQTTYRMMHLNLSGPFTMRGPGESPGLFALECAMDELAYALEMDPIALRLRNDAAQDPENGKPWSSKSLSRCYTEGAARFGWARRISRPGSMETPDGQWHVGMGMATMMYDAKSAPATASARMTVDGNVVLASATCDQGTGSYTILPQIAADALGIDVKQVRLELGDTRLPQAPISAGSQTTASVGSAVQAAALALKEKLLTAAFADVASPLFGLTSAQVSVRQGRVSARGEDARGESYADIMRRLPGKTVEAIEKFAPGSEAKDLSRYSFGAHFSEVHVHRDTNAIRIVRHVGAFGAGRIVNAKTARSQLIGGIVWGIGMALMEETHLDTHRGQIVNPDLGEYYVPVNADIGAIDGFFVTEDDPRVNPLGVKGIGEIGTIGCAAAIANAVYHATGVRVRDLPITLDKLG